VTQIWRNSIHITKVKTSACRATFGVHLNRSCDQYIEHTLSLSFSHTRCYKHLEQFVAMLQFIEKKLIYVLSVHRSIMCLCFDYHYLNA